MPRPRRWPSTTSPAWTSPRPGRPRFCAAWPRSRGWSLCRSALPNCLATPGRSWPRPAPRPGMPCPCCFGGTPRISAVSAARCWWINLTQPPGRRGWTRAGWPERARATPCCWWPGPGRPTACPWPCWPNPRPGPTLIWPGSVWPTPSGWCRPPAALSNSRISRRACRSWP